LFCFVVIALLPASCSDKKKEEVKGYPVLKVSLEETPTSFFDLFEKVELVPLETTKASLIQSIDKVIPFEDKYYIIDKWQNAVFAFDEKGGYVNKIHRIGQGPGEYALICDFGIYESNRTIMLMSPFTFIYTYNLDNFEFIKQAKLQTSIPNVQKMEFLQDGKIITYSTAWMDNSLNVFETKSGKHISGFHDKEPLVTQMFENLFKGSDGVVYFSSGFVNEVFKVTENGLDTAYSWDFGKDKIDISYYKFSIEIDDYMREKTEFLELFNSGTLKGAKIAYLKNMQNAHYYYTVLRVEPGMDINKHLFYDKKTGKSRFFNKTTEGILLNPRCFTEDYLICELEYENREMMRNVLSEEELKKLDAFSYDDNPFLVKCIFK